MKFCAYEDVGVEARFDKGILRPEAQCDALEGQVDRCRVESRGNDQAADLSNETRVGERIAMHDNSAHITNSFSQTA